MPRGKQAPVGECLRRLRKAYPQADCTLTFLDPLELMVATILSAQCTDERVNQVTPTLFAKYRSAADYADAPPGQLEDDIRSTGFFNNKARNIRGACRVIADRHGGRVPMDMDVLVTLPGIGRKTANVILGNSGHRPGGVVVDTHVGRVSRRLGWTAHDDPVKVEQDLNRLIPQEDWVRAGHELILHGRQVCHARKPRCTECFLADVCPSAGRTDK
ncbi:MAG TPA: endonuclease III [Phycisphaerae bacterium]|nr:endonuclease III [Phycisphaerae bacterium]HOI53675.1 endonuclease III [Phycisphaerae bacterium]